LSDRVQVLRRELLVLDLDVEGGLEERDEFEEPVESMMRDSRNDMSSETAASPPLMKKCSTMKRRI
jgi:hypothetical protein